MTLPIIIWLSMTGAVGCLLALFLFQVLPRNRIVAGLLVFMMLCVFVAVSAITYQALVVAPATRAH